ncbi:MAG TPA: hypothetical protein VGX00_02480 [Thermoplasmata archaeon]|nr:hypothetical protein [Thermoplasmata archaeon]
MPEPEASEVRCEACGALVPVPPDWRVVECPKCGHPATRMDADPRYD